MRYEKFYISDEDQNNREYYYRYRDNLKSTGYFDADGDYSYGSSYVELELEEFQVVRRTPKGAFIYTGLVQDKNGEKFIADYWVKKFAYPTLGEAQTSFLRRKMNQCLIYESRLDQARTAYHKGCAKFGVEPQIPKPASETDVYDLIPRSLAEAMKDEIL